MAAQPDNDRDAVAQFWKRLGDTRTGMLWVFGADQHPQPMTHFASEEDGAIWFITSADTDIATAVKGIVDAGFVYQSEKGDYQASVHGTLQVSDDGKKLDAVWSVPIAAWFEEGREDNKVRLLKFIPNEAAMWSSHSNSILVGLRVISAAAGMSESPPDVGSHRVVKFDLVA